MSSIVLYMLVILEIVLERRIFKKWKEGKHELEISREGLRMLRGTLEAKFDGKDGKQPYGGAGESGRNGVAS